MSKGDINKHLERLHPEIRRRINKYRTRLESNQDLWKGDELDKGFVEELDLARKGAQVASARRKARKKKKCQQDNQTKLKLTPENTCIPTMM